MNGRSKWEYFKAIYKRYRKIPQRVQNVVAQYTDLT